MLFEFLRIILLSLIIIKAQGTQISLTKDRSPKTAYRPLTKDRSPNLLDSLDQKKTVMNLIHRPLLVNK